MTTKPQIKKHFQWQGLDISSDSRDICLAGSLDHKVYQWCDQMQVDASIYLKIDDRSVWRIHDNDQRMLFKLAWA